jgi:hypothetical protein
MEMLIGSNWLNYTNCKLFKSNMPISHNTQKLYYK